VVGERLSTGQPTTAAAAILINLAAPKTPDDATPLASSPSSIKGGVPNPEPITKSSQHKSYVNTRAEIRHSDQQSLRERGAVVLLFKAAFSAAYYFLPPSGPEHRAPNLT